MTVPERHHEWRGSRDARVADAYHELFYRTERFAHVTWRGTEAWKYPTDLIAYAEIFFELRPILVIETGSYHGGSALFFADLIDLFTPDGRGKVLSIDVDDRERPRHPRVDWLAGSSTDPDVIETVRHEAGLAAHVDSERAVIVLLDSDHTRDHVAAEIAAYKDLVTVGSYLVVEDTNLGGNPVVPGWGPGPREAADHLLATESDRWERDRHRERFLLSANPGGWLRRTR